MTAVLEEIHHRVATARQAVEVRGSSLLPPLLVVGTSERVGSNWLSDTLGAAGLPQHNEPLRQQLGSTHPLSALNPNPADLDELTDAVIGAYGRHWLVTFVVSKYAPVRHVVKETNLFFATGTLLRLFPESPIVVASRSPLGVVGSFRRRSLFARWRYADRYRQLSLTTSFTRWRRWAPVLPTNEPEETTVLVRLIVLNTLLLADALSDTGRTSRSLFHLPYERAVFHQAEQVRAIGRTIDAELTGTWSGRSPRPSTTAADDVFATTNTRTTLVAPLPQATADQVHETMTELLEAIRPAISTQAAAHAADWLAGDHRYQLTPTPGARPQSRPQDRPAPVCPDLEYTQRGRVSWRNLLVSNDEYASFMNSLADVGLVNTTYGTRLLAIPMPCGRGGRLYIERGRLPGDIHHAIGNVQVWCADGPGTDELRGGPTARWMHGAAWNTPANTEYIRRARHRHLTGASRSVGIRLVRDGYQGVGDLAELAARLKDWTRSLTDRDRTLDELDAPLLRGLQPDI